MDQVKRPKPSIRGTIQRDVRQTAEWAARHSYGRLVAYLAVRSQDIAAAEDALSDAFMAALKIWPDNGIPKNPEAWLLVTKNGSPTGLFLGDRFNRRRRNS